MPHKVFNDLEPEIVALLRVELGGDEVPLADDAGKLHPVLNLGDLPIRVMELGVV